MNNLKSKIEEDKSKLQAVTDEVLKVWNEDGDCGEIQMKTPIAWHRVLRLANDVIDDKKLENLG